MTDTVDELDFDIRRSVILGQFIAHCGVPRSRVISKRGRDIVEIYSFPPSGSTVHRFLSLGASSCEREDGRNAEFEVFMALRSGLGGATESSIISLMLDVIAYGLRSDVWFRPGYAIPPSPLMPPAWPTKAIILDELRGEPEELSAIHLGTEHINIFWLIPIFEVEHARILRSGPDVFFEAADAMQFDLTDPERSTALWKE